MPSTTSQAANAVLMVYPTSFAFNEETAQTNSFQHRSADSDAAVRAAAQREFDDMVQQLRERGIQVLVFADDADPAKPDAVFPNNWLSTWPDGRIYLYPMATPSRRLERSPDAQRLLGEDFVVKDTIDLSASELDGRFLEGTGAVVFDHPNKIAYGCISPRCSEELLRAHADELGYRPVTFHAVDQDRQPVYHTNVVMGVQTTTAVVCGASITDTTERDVVLASLREHHIVVDISMEQMNRFCGNVIEVRNDRGEALLLLSRTAYDSFTAAQLGILTRDKTALPVDIPTIETAGGGSTRCMVAEIFLAPRPR